MATINIGAANADDQFYRYKMPKLQARVGAKCPAHGPRAVRSPEVFVPVASGTTALLSASSFSLASPAEQAAVFFSAMYCCCRLRGAGMASRPTL